MAASDVVDVTRMTTILGVVERQPLGVRGLLAGRAFSKSFAVSRRFQKSPSLYQGEVIVIVSVEFASLAWGPMSLYTHIALPTGKGRSLVAIIQIQLSQNAADVVLHGTLTYEEALCNLLVGPHFDEQGEYFTLPVRQR